MVFAATAFPPFGPFPDDGPNIAVILSRIIRDEPRLGQDLDEWRSLLSRCLDKEPANRPTARQVYDLILESELEIEPPPILGAVEPASSWQPPPTPGTPSAASGAARDRPAPPPPVSGWQPPRTPGLPSPRDLTQERSPESSVPTPIEQQPSVPPLIHSTIPPQSSTPPPFPTPGGPYTPPPFPEPTRDRPRSKTGLVLSLLVAGALVAGGAFYFLGRDGGPGGGGGGFPAAFEGKWKGTVSVTDGQYNHSYSAAVQLFTGNDTTEIVFDGQTLCTQTLHLKSGSTADTLKLDLSGGGAECPTGEVTLGLDGDKLGFHLGGVGSSTGSGTLTKQG